MKLNEAVSGQRAEVKDWGFAEASTGTPFLWIDFTFLEIQAENGEELTIRHYMYLTDGTLEFVLRDLESLKWTGKTIFELDRTHPNHHSLMGAVTHITTEMETYKGKQRCKVKFLGDLQDKPMDSNAVKMLSKKLEGKIAAYRSRNGGGMASKVEAKKSTVPASAPAATDKEEDEIPF